MESGISDYFAKNHLVLPEGWESELHLEMGYRQGGYGQYDERILQVIREEFCRNGLPLDPTYTGKGILGNEAVHRRTSVTGLRCAFYLPEARRCSMTAF